MVSHAAQIRHDEAMASLHPVFKSQVELVIADLRARGWQPVLVYGRRTAAQQKKLHEGGVGAKVSWHVASTHALLPSRDHSSFETVRGAAADMIDARWGWDGPCASKDYQFWKDLGASAKAHALQWGGNWKNRDVAHIEMKFIEDRPIGSLIA